MIHSFPFYIADWRDSSARIEFSTGEKLLYLELLFWCWKDGDLPTSDEALLNISGMREREFRVAWPNVQAQFFLQDGRYHHHKVDEKRPSLEEWREARIEAGKRGGQATAIAKAIAKAKAQANAKLQPKPSSSSSSSSSSSEHSPLRDECKEGVLFDIAAPKPKASQRQTTQGAMTPEQRDWFAEYLSTHPKNTIQLKSAAKLFHEKVKTQDCFDFIITTLRREAAGETQYMEGPCNWLASHLALYASGVSAATPIRTTPTVKLSKTDEALELARQNFERRGSPFA